MLKLVVNSIILFFIFSQVIFAQANIYGESNQLRREAFKEYKLKNYSLFVEKLESALKLRPNHPSIMYNLAIGYLLNDKKEKSLSTIENLSNMGVYYPAEKDSDFVSLWGEKSFKESVDRMKKNKEKIGDGKLVFELPEKDLLTEGTAIDPKTGSIYAGSIHKKKIFVKNKSGKIEVFADGNKLDFWGVFGIKIDSERRILWACANSIGQMLNFEKEKTGYASLLKFNLDTKELLNKYVLGSENENHLFGDLTIAKNGDVYISDSGNNSIYKLKNNGTKIEMLIESGNFVSLQGITFNENEEILFAADYALGLYSISVNDKKVNRIELPATLTDLSIDGLYFYKNSLIAIQNGINPHRVIKINLDKNGEKITSWKILEANNNYFNEPTLGDINDGYFYYVANSQWTKFKEDGSTESIEKIDNPVILKLEIK